MPTTIPCGPSGGPHGERSTSRKSQGRRRGASRMVRDTDLTLASPCSGSWDIAWPVKRGWTRRWAGSRGRVDRRPAPRRRRLPPAARHSENLGEVGTVKLTAYVQLDDSRSPGSAGSWQVHARAFGAGPSAS